MRKIINFIKTAAIGGLLVIVPIAIVLFVLGHLFYGLYSLAEAVMSELHIRIDDAAIMVGIAALALLGLSFLTGVVVRTRLGVISKRWLNRHIGKRIPMYNALATLTRRFAGREGTEFAPVEVDLYDSSARVIGFRVEDLPGRRCTVFIPSAPVATVGNVYVVSHDKITAIDASVADTLTAITQWGVDAKTLYDRPAVNTEESAGSDDE